MSGPLEPLLCFRHCGKVNVLCFTIPNNCPICGNELPYADLSIPPFRIPGPLSWGNPNKNCLLIKPTTNNSFMRDFKKGDLLHIGLSNSNSIIYEFNENGISSNKMEWTNFLSISLASLPDKFNQLDEVLENSKSMDIWTPEKYHDTTNNCFDYVVHILNSSSENFNCNWTKLKLTQDFISPAISKVFCFLTIIRNVSENGFFLQTNILDPLIN